MSSSDRSVIWWPRGRALVDGGSYLAHLRRCPTRKLVSANRRALSLRHRGVCTYHFLSIRLVFLFLVLLDRGCGLVSRHDVLVCPPLLIDLPDASSAKCDAMLGLPMEVAIDHSRRAAQFAGEERGKKLRCADVRCVNFRLVCQWFAEAGTRPLLFLMQQQAGWSF
jgi:hypothetical protein